MTIPRRKRAPRRGTAGKGLAEKGARLAEFVKISLPERVRKGSGGREVGGNIYKAKLRQLDGKLLLCAESYSAIAKFAGWPSGHKTARARPLS